MVHLYNEILCGLLNGIETLLQTQKGVYNILLSRKGYKHKHGKKFEKNNETRVLVFE